MSFALRWINVVATANNDIKEVQEYMYISNGYTIKNIKVIDL